VKRPARGKGRIELNGLQIPIQAVSGKKPIEAAKFIPVLPAGGAGSLGLIRRTDLIPKPYKAAAAAGLHNFGDLLIDIFNPTYGSYYPIGGQHAFIFSLARVSWIDHAGWRMQLAWDKYGYERFSFGVVKRTNRSYLRVQLGETRGAGSGHGAIVGVKAQLRYFFLDLSGLSYKFFDLILTPVDTYFEFYLHHDFNPRVDTVLEIQQLELYNSIRTFPAEEVLG